MRQSRERRVDVRDAARLAELGNQIVDLGSERRRLGDGTTGLTDHTDEVLPLAHTHPPSLVEPVPQSLPIAAGRCFGHTGQRGPIRPKPSVVLAPVSSTNDQGEWLAAYVGRVASLVEDAGRLNVRLAGEWAARSLEDSEWTVDTLTADLIEAWDQLTPLAERGLDLWLELVQQAIRPGQPS
jgi:hypothetical protein